MSTSLRFCRRPIDPDALGFRELHESDVGSKASELKAALEARGYLFLRGLIPRAEVLAARRELLSKYAILGEVDDRHEISEGIAGERSAREHVNLRAFRQCLVSGHHYQRVARHPALAAVVQDLLEPPVSLYDYLWPRMLPPGSGCALHQDAPYLKGPRAEDLLSVWTPLGDVRREDGALVLLEGSHRSALLRAEYGDRDVDAEPGLGWYGTDLEVARRRIGGEWVSADFRAGDVLVFDVYTLHGALDNLGERGRVRLSSDSRFQSLCSPIPARWMGERAVGRGAERVFLPRRVDEEDLLNEGLVSEFHPVDELGRMKG